MHSILVVPHSVTLMVLGELTSYHPDPIFNFLSTYSSGESMANDRSALVVPESGVHEVLLNLLAETGLSAMQPPKDNTQAVVMLFSDDVLKRDEYAKLTESFRFINAEDLYLPGVDTRGMTGLCFNSQLMLDPENYAPDSQAVLSLWSVMQAALHVMYPYHVESTEPFTRH